MVNLTVAVDNVMGAYLGTGLGERLQGLSRRTLGRMVDNNIIRLANIKISCSYPNVPMDKLSAPGVVTGTCRKSWVKALTCFL
ncbi:hypothetical protein [Adhaeribacter arboris]|uniref:hypothetical protein n=1 Tax=Adhaeribacter arboris TaxID=2072846 RepID=UPI001E5B5787|nr:hypothetical protein [Adhaeribacter arboris]